MYLYVYNPSRPALARHQSKEIAFSPFLLSHVHLFLPQAHVRYELATVPLEPCRPNTDCIATSRPPLASIHTHSLSLSLSQRQWDNNHAYCPSSSSARILISGTSLGLFDLITLSNSHADSNSAIQLAAPVRQWAFSSLLSHSSFYFPNSSLALATPFISSATRLPRAF